MLGPGLVQQGHDLGPFLSILHHKLKNYIILAMCPSPVDFAVIEVVEPSFPTVLG